MTIDDGIGREAYALIEEMYPICRSITGEGVRATLAIIDRLVPLQITEVPSGSPALDWTVPPEWNIRDAWVADASGRRVIDFRRSNLHVVNYSEPVHATMSLEQLRPHLHTLPDRPDAVPYRTSYYERAWGFCLSQHELEALADGPYEVAIESTLEPGSLTYAEFVVPGSTEDEILISAHVCHPSLCDDNLSGVAVSALLARQLRDGPTPRHTIRFLYAPGTIGALTWLSRNRDRVGRVRHGLTLTCLGDAHPFTYKRTLSGDRPVDRAAAHVLSTSGTEHQLIDFFPYGYDERQFNSPGFRMPVGSLMRGRHGLFPEYHTSDDNLDFVTARHLGESFEVLSRIVRVVDGDRRLRNTAPYGEPQLGSRGLYRALGGTTIADAQLVMLWVLTLSDGDHSMLDIAERAGVPFEAVRDVAQLLEQHGLLVPADEPPPPVSVEPSAGRRP
jgi:aminopeptidase-like protein